MLSLVAAACGDDKGATTTPSTGTAAAVATTAASTPISGGKATYLYHSELGGTFDPVKLVSVTAVILDGTAGYAVYDALVGTDPVSLEVKPQLAESLVSSEGGKVWTLKLRPNVKFSDGTALDAEAVKFNWERHRDAANASAARGVVAAMTAIDVVDAVTVKITLADPNQQFARTIGQYAINFIASPTAIKAGTIAQKPVGAGPFLLKEWVRDDHMTFVRNPTYWNAPRPYLDELTIKPIIDGTQRLNATTTGQGDMMFTLNYVDAKKGQDAGLSLDRINLGAGTVIIFNLTKPLGADVRFRRALRLAIDNAQINSVAFQGLAPVADTFAQQTSVFYDSTAKYPSPDKVEAQKLIDQVAAERGGTIEFSIIVGQPTQAVALAIQAQLSQFKNIKVNVDTQSTGAATTAVIQKNYDVAMWNNFHLDPEPRIFDFFLTGSPRNYEGYSNPAMDVVLKAGRAATEQAARKTAYATVYKIINDDVPIINVARADHLMLTNKKRLQNLSFFEDGIVRWELAWVKP